MHANDRRVIESRLEVVLNELDRAELLPVQLLEQRMLAGVHRMDPPSMAAVASLERSSHSGQAHGSAPDRELPDVIRRVSDEHLREGVANRREHDTLRRV